MNSTFSHAFVRPPSPSLANCELLHLPRQPFDFERTAQQHRNYVATLEHAGVAVTILPETLELPDAVFVEDVAVLLDDLVILCRPGTATRLAETARIRPELTRLGRPIFEIQSPGTLEGGDVLQIGRTLFVGRSTRTNREGIRQLQQFVEPFGYTVTDVRVEGSLHLKTAITSPRPGLLVANGSWIDPLPFREFEIVAVPAAEPWGANTLPVNGRVLVASSAPRTAELLVARGVNAQLVDVSELQKAEAGLTCLSLLYGQRP